MGGPTPILNVDFESYGSTAALLGDCIASGGTWFCVEDNRTNLIELDPTTAPPIAGLTKSMRYHYNHSGDGCNSITIERALRFPVEQEVWAEFYIRWSPNFTTHNTLCSPNDHKVIFGDTQGGSSGRWSFKAGMDSGPTHNLAVGRPLGPSGMPGSYHLNGPYLSANALWDGNWHVLRLYFRNSTTASSNDGAIKVWIDGILRHDEFGFNNQKVSGARDLLEGFSFAHNKDDGPPGIDMYIWWGRIMAWNQDPGW